jgi:hypothetical protein
MASAVEMTTMMIEMEKMRAEMEKMKAENDTLKKKAGGAKPITFKVSEKGAVSVYGLNARFPVTLYKNQWLRLMEVMDGLKEFIAENEGKLTE